MKNSRYLARPTTRQAALFGALTFASFAAAQQGFSPSRTPAAPAADTPATSVGGAQDMGSIVPGWPQCTRLITDEATGDCIGASSTPTLGMLHPLGTLLELRGVTFDYKDPEAIHELAGERTGFIAQEVETVLPDWVEDADGYKTLTIRGFEALAVEALRELRAEVERLRGVAERVEALESALPEVLATR